MHRLYEVFLHTKPAYIYIRTKYAQFHTQNQYNFRHRLSKVLAHLEVNNCYRSYPVCLAICWNWCGSLCTSSSSTWIGRITLIAFWFSMMAFTKERIFSWNLDTEQLQQFHNKSDQLSDLRLGQMCSNETHFLLMIFPELKSSLHLKGQSHEILEGCK